MKIEITVSGLSLPEAEEVLQMLAEKGHHNVQADVGPRETKEMMEEPPAQKKPGRKKKAKKAEPVEEAMDDMDDMDDAKDVDDASDMDDMGDMDDMDESPVEEKVITLEEVTKKLRAFAQAKGKVQAKKILKKFGVDFAAELDAADYERFLKALG